MIERKALAGLALSASALVSILLHEGYSDKAYTPVKGDRLTIGFGSAIDALTARLDKLEGKV
jgi:lysozyme